MNVLITAGGIPSPEDSLYEVTQGTYKALIPLEGKPIIQWIVDALSTVKGLENIVIVGLSPNTPIKSTLPLHFLPDQGDLILNTRSGLDGLRKIAPNDEYALMCSGDIPAITPEMISWMLKAIPELDADLVYTIVERKVMETTFPESERTYLRLKDKDVCGGDIFAIRLDRRIQEHPIWDKLIAARKKPLKQAAMFGFDTLLLVLTHQITIYDLERKLSKKLGLTARTLNTPYAEMGMDVDKVFQLRIVEEYLSKKVQA
jgi:GTP:adenosylcobinamide-phosphate guanylyltransferase